MPPSVESRPRRSRTGVRCDPTLRSVDAVQVRSLTAGDVELYRQIDRSEHQHQRYVVTDGELVSRAFEFDVPAWDPAGDGDHSVAGVIDVATAAMARGADLIGAFVADGLAGLAVVEAEFEPGTAWLALLHVDRSHRRRGVASLLWSHVVERSRSVGARAIYVSATASDSAVGFYLSRGCRLATESEINDRLFALEPEDIHLIRDLS